MTTYELKFDLYSKVNIIELKREGLITEINITKIGIKYCVRYFDKAEANMVWFLEDELEEKKIHKK